MHSGNSGFCITRRGFVGGMLSAGALAGCGSTAAVGKASSRPLLRFGVVSDVHVRLAKGGGSLAEGYDTVTLEKTFAWFRDNGADAVVIAGDMADKGLTRELKALADTWFRVFPGDRAPDGRKVERIFVFGNHDAFGLQNGKAVFADEAVLKREAIEADPRKAWDECFHEEWKPYFAKQVNGFDFFCSHWQPGIWCNGYSETGCSGCADAFRGLMEKCDPSRPFFYVQHPHPQNTVYGEGAWGMDDGSATKLLSAFPQAVAFSGHSHQPLTNDRALWRGAFTSVATGSLRFLGANALWNRIREAGYENGGCCQAMPGVGRNEKPAREAKFDAPKLMPSETKRPDIRVGQLVSVYSDRMVFAKREFESSLPLCDDWVVELPARASSFAARAAKAKPAEFPAGAELRISRGKAKTRGMKRKAGIEVPRVALPVLNLEFPAATEGGRVAEYEISSRNALGDSYDTRICAIGGLFPKGHAAAAKGVSVPVALSSLPAGADSVSVTPLDSYGVRGRPLVAAIPPATRGK